MKTRYIGPKKSILVLAVGVLICWAVAGNTSEQWDAKASARVNLRRNPSSNGVILSIVPKGHKVRIMEKKGLWCQVDVEGEIHGKGWVFAEYLEEILPKVPETASASQTVWVELESSEQEQNIHPAEPPKARRESKKENLLNTPPSEKASRVDATEQSSIRNEFRGAKDKSITVLKGEIPMSREPAHIAPAQTPSEVRLEDEKAKPLNEFLSDKVSPTGVKQHVSARNEWWDAKNESNALPQAETALVGESVLPPAQPPYAGFKQDALGISEKSSSCVIEQGNASGHQKSLPGGEKKQGGSVPDTPSLVREKAMTDVRAVAASVKRSSVSLERKRPINRRESMGPVEIALKLLSIVLSCLIILFLHRANKLATIRYDALRQFQHGPDTRQYR